MGETKPRIFLPAVPKGAKAQASRRAAPTAKYPLTKPLLAAKPATAKESSPPSRPSPAAKPSSIAASSKKSVNTSPKIIPQPSVTTEKKLTLSSLLKTETELKNAKSWCRGFAHGTRYDAFLGMINSEDQAILRYVDLPKKQQSFGRSNQWKKEGVFFRIVKKTTRIIDSMGSTGASGGVILFMPLDISLDLKLHSLSATDTQMCMKPVIPSKEKDFNSLKTSGNLVIAEIAFGEKIPLSYISEVFLLSGKEPKTTEEDATNCLLKNGFRKGEVHTNSRGNYQQFVRCEL